MDTVSVDVRAAPSRAHGVHCLAVDTNRGSADVKAAPSRAHGVPSRAHGVPCRAVDTNRHSLIQHGSFYPEAQHRTTSRYVATRTCFDLRVYKNVWRDGLIEFHVFIIHHKWTYTNNNFHALSCIKISSYRI
jgi:hypothetical protein